MNKLMFYKLMNRFFEKPYDEIYLRQLARELKFSPYAVKTYTDILVKESFLAEERKANLRYFKANTKNLFFKHLKIAFNMHKIEKSGIINFLNKNISGVSSIVLFGSAAKGEDEEKSDIDIVLIGKEKSISIAEFEKKLKKNINLHIFTWTEWNKQYKNNKAFYFDVIAYGTPLYGELPIVK